MKKRIIYTINRLKEQLWFRPFIFCLFSIAMAFLAQFADDTFLKNMVPQISKESLSGLLNTLSASMLVIAIFAVASMISAFSAASSNATPRSFKLVVTDDVSQNALSIFIGAFIFSIIATVALKNGVYAKAGVFILFIITIITFAVVIIMFLRWVDRISRLGRLSNTILQVEGAAKKTLLRTVNNPFMGGIPLKSTVFTQKEKCFANKTGYIHTINMELLQELAQSEDLRIEVCRLPGSFVSINTVLTLSSTSSEVINEKILSAFTIENERTFDDDPRFGMITLSEIASRALSPGINDPGTAIQIIGSMVRLFTLFNKDANYKVIYDRISVPAVKVSDMFTDAFRPIARDGADNIEVMTRLQKGLSILNTLDHPEIKKEATKHSLQAFRRAEAKLDFQSDIEELRSVRFSFSIT